MPDKRHPCGKSCIRCWRNKLKHGNKESKRLLKKMGIKIDDSYKNKKESSDLKRFQQRPWNYDFDEEQPNTY